MVAPSMDALGWLRKQLEEAEPDLLREMVSTFAHALMSAEADAICGAAYGERSPDRVNRRNGGRERDFDTRVGTMELRIPKLRRGSYFPGWLLTPRRRAEQALVAVVAECYVKGVSTRRVDGLVKTLGIDGISKSQVSELAKSLDEAVAAFRTRPLDGGPYTYVWIDASNLVIGIASAAVGGMGATFLQQHRELGSARRLRRDQEREDALKSLVLVCAQLESHIERFQHAIGYPSVMPAKDPHPVHPNGARRKSLRQRGEILVSHRPEKVRSREYLLPPIPKHLGIDDPDTKNARLAI